MAGFKFEVGIKKRIAVVKDDWLLQERKNLLQDWAQEVEAKAKELASRPIGYPGYAKGVRTGKLVGSISISEFESTASGKSLNKRVHVDESRTMTPTGPYARFHEYGTGLHTEYPGQSPDWILPKRGKRMMWLERGAKPYRGRFIRAMAVADFETRKLKRPKLIQKRSSPTRPSKYRTTYNRRESGGPWLQSAEMVKGVQPRRFMRGAASWAKTKLAEKYNEWRDELAARYAARLRNG